MRSELPANCGCVAGCLSCLGPATQQQLWNLYNIRWKYEYACRDFQLLPLRRGERVLLWKDKQTPAVPGVVAEVVNEDNFLVAVAKPGTSDMIHTYFKVKRHRLGRPVSDFCRDKDWAAKAAVSCSFVFGAPEVCLCCAWVRTACAGWGGVFEYTVPPHDIRCPLRPRPTTPPCPVVVPAQAHEDRACGPGKGAQGCQGGRGGGGRGGRPARAQIPAEETGSPRQLHGAPHSRGAVAMSVMSFACGVACGLIFGSGLAKFPNMYFFHI